MGDFGVEKPQPEVAGFDPVGAGQEALPAEPADKRGPVIELNLDDSAGASAEEDVFSELLGESPGLSDASDEPQGGQEAAPGLISEGDVATTDLADLYVKQGHYEQGIEIYRRMLDQDPDNGEIRQKLEDALSLANLLTKRPREGRPRGEGDLGVAPRSATPTESRPADAPVDPGPEQVRQAKIQRLQAWLEQLKRSQSR